MAVESRTHRVCVWGGGCWASSRPAIELVVFYELWVWKNNLSLKKKKKMLKEWHFRPGPWGIGILIAAKIISVDSQIVICLSIKTLIKPIAVINSKKICPVIESTRFPRLLEYLFQCGTQKSYKKLSLLKLIVLPAYFEPQAKYSKFKYLLNCTCQFSWHMWYF